MRALTYALVGALALVAGLIASWYWSQTQSVTVEQTASPAPTEHPLVALDGSVRTLSDWHGKVLVVNFWATWCAPCREEIPLLQSAREKYRDRNLEIIGVAIDEAEYVIEYRDELMIRYPLLLAVDDPIELLSRFGDESGALPHSVVLDVTGKILATHTGPLSAGQLEEFIHPHL